MTNVQKALKVLRQFKPEIEQCLKLQNVNVRSQFLDGSDIDAEKFTMH